MQENVAKALAEALEGECGIEVNLRDSYSGRCMYGKTTWAISGDFGMGDVAVAWAYACQTDPDLRPDMLSVSEDSMGLGVVIY